MTLQNYTENKEQNKIEIFQSADNKTEIKVKFEQESVWLNRHQLAVLFNRDIKTIGKHINSVFKEGELEETSTVAKFATVQKHFLQQSCKAFTIGNSKKQPKHEQFQHRK